MESLGKIAFDAYGENRLWRTFNGDTMPRWEEVPAFVRAGWEAAGQAVAAALAGVG